MDLKSRLLGRAKSKRVTFLSEFYPVTLLENGSGELVLPAEAIKPIEAVLVIPISVDGVELYEKAIGCEASWVKTGNKIRLSAAGCEELSDIEESSYDVLIAFPRYYNARRISQLLPGEVRGMTRASADVMGMISERDPDMVTRISEAIGAKVQNSGGSISQMALSTAIEAQINVELTMNHPDLLTQIEDIQTSQEAIKAAYMIGADVDFMRTLFMLVPEGDSMIRELIMEIDPPVTIQQATESVTVEAIAAAEAEVEELTKAPAAKKRGRKAVKVSEVPDVPLVEPMPTVVEPVKETAIAAALELEIDDDLDGDGDDDDDDDDDFEFGEPEEIPAPVGVLDADDFDGDDDGDDDGEYEDDEEE